MTEWYTARHCQCGDSDSESESVPVPVQWAMPVDYCQCPAAVPLHWLCQWPSQCRVSEPQQADSATTSK